MIDLLRDIEEYIAAMEVSIDGEFGSCRDAASLEADGDMPHLFFRVRGAIAALAAAAPAAPSRVPLTEAEAKLKRLEDGLKDLRAVIVDGIARCGNDKTKPLATFIDVLLDPSYYIGVTATNGDPHGTA